MRKKQIIVLLALSLIFSGIPKKVDIQATSYYQKKTVTLKNAKNITVNGKSVKRKKIVKIMCKKEGKYTICYQKNKKKCKKVIWIDKTVPKIMINGTKDNSGTYRLPVTVTVSDNVALKNYEINGYTTSMSKKAKENSFTLTRTGTYHISVADKAGQKAFVSFRIADENLVNPTVKPTAMVTINPITTSTNNPTNQPTINQTADTSKEEPVLYDIASTVGNVKVGDYEYRDAYIYKDDWYDRYYFRCSFTNRGTKSVYPRVQLAFYDKNKQCIGYYNSLIDDTRNWNVSLRKDETYSFYLLSFSEKICNFSNVKYWAIVNSDPRK